MLGILVSEIVCFQFLNPSWLRCAPTPGPNMEMTGQKKKKVQKTATT